MGGKVKGVLRWISGGFLRLPLAPYASRTVRGRQRFVATSIVLAVYLILGVVVAREPGRRQAEGIADTISLDIFSGDAPIRAPGPKAEVKAAETKAPPPSRASSDLTEQDKPPPPQEPIKPASPDDPVMKQVMEALANTPTLDHPVELPPSEDAPPAVAAYQRAASGLKSCELTERVQDRLQDTTEVHQTLARIPRQSRSVANAVMLWNGLWVDPASLGGDEALAPLRAAILEEVDAASPKCRSEELKGPRLLNLIGEDGTTVIVVGSGDWKWADLLPPKPSVWQRLFSFPEPKYIKR